jgi:short-subunit dehydrogenase
MNILITGASSGIGAALARHYGSRGDVVWLAGRRTAHLQTEVDAIRARGGTAHAVTLDVERADHMESELAALDAQAGGFDVVVVNAGVGGKGATPSSLRFADAKQVLQVNYVGAIASILGALQPMLQRRRGHIAVVSSLAGIVPLPIALDYGSTKAGLSYFVEAMRSDLRAHGVDVTLVLPGFVHSEMTSDNKFPMPFIISAEDAARRIASAIDAKKHTLRFPFAYRAMFAVVALLPTSLVGWLAMKQTKSSAAGLPKRD